MALHILNQIIWIAFKVKYLLSKCLGLVCLVRLISWHCDCGGQSSRGISRNTLKLIWDSFCCSFCKGVRCYMFLVGIVTVYPLSLKVKPRWCCHFIVLHLSEAGLCQDSWLDAGFTQSIMRSFVSDLRRRFCCSRLSINPLAFIDWMLIYLCSYYIVYIVSCSASVNGCWSKEGVNTHQAQEKGCSIRSEDCKWAAQGIQGLCLQVTSCFFISIWK